MWCTAQRTYRPDRRALIRLGCSSTSSALSAIRAAVDRDVGGASRDRELVNESVWLDPSAPGAALPGRKVLWLVHGMLAGADSIDDVNVLRAGSTGMILGHRVMASSTLGTFLRAFTFGHVRQFDRVLDVALARAWGSAAGPGDGPLVIDIDGFIGEVYSDQKQGASYGYTKKLGVSPDPRGRCRYRRGAADPQPQGGRPTPSAGSDGSLRNCSPASVALVTPARS